MAAGDVDVRNTANSSFKGAVFDGINDSISFSAITMPASGHTLAIWFKSPEIVAQMVFGQGGAIYPLYFAVGASYYSVGAGGIDLSYAQTGDNAWHHYCIVREDNTHVQLYVDGVGKGSKVVTDNVVLFEYIGAGLVFAKGQMRDFFYYRRALTSAEITALKNGNYVNPKGLKIHLPLRDNYIDVSGNGTTATNNGTFLCIVDTAIATAVKAQRVLTSAAGKFLIAKGQGGQVITAGITEA